MFFLPKKLGILIRNETRPPLHPNCTHSSTFPLLACEVYFMTAIEPWVYVYQYEFWSEGACCIQSWKKYVFKILPPFQWNLYVSLSPSTIRWLGQACKLICKTGLDRSSYSGRSLRNVNISLERREYVCCVCIRAPVRVFVYICVFIAGLLLF